MSKPVGGRGKKAPYKTVVIRVPESLASDFKKEIDFYHTLVSEGLIQPEANSQDLLKSHGKTDVNCMEAIMEARQILKSKKSARQSLLKLLQVMYGDMISDNVLE